MKKQLILEFLIFISVAFIYGCSQINPINNPATNLPYITSNETLGWMEYQGRFYTTDLERAQKEIPFPILLPTYLPDMEQMTYLPDIDGPLYQSQNGEIIVNIKYYLDNAPGELGILIIRESNNRSSLGNPEVNPHLEQTEIEGISVIKTRDDWSPDTDAYFSFNSDNVFYIVETHNLLNEESYKIVESMIRQLK